MIPLDTLLDPRLWKAVAEPFQAGDYRTAIIDGIQFLGDLIREKTALESDGVALIAQAFGGPNPKLKISSHSD